MMYKSYTWSVNALCAVSHIVLCFTAIFACGVRHNVFRATKGYKLSQGTQLKQVYSKTNTATFCSILCSIECGSATYSVKYRTCITFVEKFYNSSIVWSQDPDWVVLYREEMRVQFEDWTLVFRAQKEINSPLYNAWIATSEHDDSPLTRGVLNGCYRLDNVGNCKKHFRSSILENWKNIKQVKFSLYLSGSEVGYIVFNGTSSTRDSWFDQSNILYSSWTWIAKDLTIAKFSIPGDISSKYSRRFVISGAAGSCSTDQSYFLALDQRNDDCQIPWSCTITNYPVFIHSKKDRMARLANNRKEYTHADIMAVFVKF